MASFLRFGGKHKKLTEIGYTTENTENCGNQNFWDPREKKNQIKNNCIQNVLR